MTGGVTRPLTLPLTLIWAPATAVLGAATLVILLAFSMLPDVRAAYPNGDFSSALNAFQHAATPGDLAAVFGAPADPARLRAMTAGNTLDLLAFIPAYGCFLVAGVMMLVGGDLKNPLGLAAIALAGIGIAGDLVETTRQLRMTMDWPHAPSLLPIAPWCLTKFFGLAGSALGVSAISLAGARKRWILGSLGVLPILAVSADAGHVLPAPALMSAVFGAFWVALLLVGILESVRARGA